ncbi:MAG: hypothetical protein L6R40_007644 [Gallowayella cf. fulva]|nr:MAG: hypothetical protein L6R40_007644 [Xanthomendoza cf. fulva]
MVLPAPLVRPYPLRLYAMTTTASAASTGLTGRLRIVPASSRCILTLGRAGHMGYQWFGGSGQPPPECGGSTCYRQPLLLSAFSYKHTHEGLPAVDIMLFSLRTSENEEKGICSGTGTCLLGLLCSALLETYPTLF